MRVVRSGVIIRVLLVHFKNDAGTSYTTNAAQDKAFLKLFGFDEVCLINRYVFQALVDIDDFACTSSARTYKIGKISLAPARASISSKHMDHHV
jgi:hypothetical protein